MRRSLLVALFIISATCFACAPRYTTRSTDSEDIPASSPELNAIIAGATRSYEHGVDLFTEEQYDSARVYLEQAVALLGQDVDWSPYDEALSERRHLLYKCRYFLERIPSALAERPPGTELDDIKPLKPVLPSVELVRNDPSANVRLAAIEALAGRLDEPGVGLRLLRTLPEQSSPMLQMTLLDVLLPVGEGDVIEVAAPLLETEGLDEAVRERLLQAKGESA